MVVIGVLGWTKEKAPPVVQAKAEATPLELAAS